MTEDYLLCVQHCRTCLVCLWQQFLIPRRSHSVQCRLLGVIECHIAWRNCIGDCIVMMLSCRPSCKRVLLKLRVGWFRLVAQHMHSNLTSDTSTNQVTPLGSCSQAHRLLHTQAAGRLMPAQRIAVQLVGKDQRRQIRALRRNVTPQACAMRMLRFLWHGRCMQARALMH